MPRMNRANHRARNSVMYLWSIIQSVLKIVG